jgi:hypothetical protein
MPYVQVCVTDLDIVLQNMTVYNSEHVSSCKQFRPLIDCNQPPFENFGIQQQCRHSSALYSVSEMQYLMFMAKYLMNNP